MGKKPTPSKLSAEEQEAAARQKANEAFCKAAKDDQLAKAEEALAKGASVDFVNERGHGIAHIAAAFGSLSILRLLYSKNAKIFDMKNAMKKTPLQVAQDIGEEDAALLIVALVEGKDDGTIGLAKGLDMDDDDGAEVEPTPSDTPCASSAKGSDVEEAAAIPPASPIEVS